MIEQQGQVVEALAGRVQVRLGGTSGCSACDAGRGCGAGVFGRLLRRKPVVLEFENDLDARNGQSVMVGLPDRLFLTLVLRLYLYPVLAGIGGAALGHYLASRSGFQAAGTDIAALTGGIALATPVLWATRRLNREFPGGAAVHLLRIIESTSCNENQEVSL